MCFFPLADGFVLNCFLLLRCAGLATYEMVMLFFRGFIESCSQRLYQSLSDYYYGEDEMGRVGLLRIKTSCAMNIVVNQVLSYNTITLAVFKT